MPMTAENSVHTVPYIFGAGTRLSSAYTMGRKGLPCPKHSSEPSSAANRAWKAGHREWLQHKERQGD